jgi:hypothetical protein
MANACPGKSSRASPSASWPVLDSFTAARPKCDNIQHRKSKRVEGWLSLWQLPEPAAAAS